MYFLKKQKEKQLHKSCLYLCSHFKRIDISNKSKIDYNHHDRTEGCTVRAMDRAASRGHLEVVQWLHSNRSEGCTRSLGSEN
jgi:hypothetical protein